MNIHARVLGFIAHAALVSFALVPAACSFQNTNQVKCTQNADCMAAFGAEAVCRSDGFCTGGSAGGDDAGADSGDNSGPWTFVSFPDFLNADVGDVSALTTADRVVAGAPPVSGNNVRTTSVWVRVDPATGIRTVFSFGTNSGGGKWDTDIDATGLYELGIGQGRTDAAGSTSVTDGAWHHLVTVLPQGGTTLADVRMYIDGNPITFSAASSTMIDTKTGNIMLGQSVNAQAIQQFAGSVDDFAIWSQELDAGQVRALYSFGNEPTLGYDAGEVQALFEGYKAKQDIQINGRLWRYQASGLTGTLGQVSLTGGDYSVNLGGGAGFVSP